MPQPIETPGEVPPASAADDVLAFYWEWHGLDVWIRRELEQTCREHGASAETHRALDAALDRYQGALRLLIAHLVRRD